MRFLVTGGAGFIGSHLVECLFSQGNDVSVLDDFNDFYAPAIKRQNLASVADAIKIYEADIRDADVVEQIVRSGNYDVICHLAARAGVRPSIVDPALYLSTNINGTFNVLEAARKAGVPKLIFASSSSVYGVTKEIPFREDVCISQTISPYAATKLACEQLCSNYSHLYGMRIVALRFFTVYGPRQRPDLAIHQFAKNIQEGSPIRQYGNGTTRRDYTYIDDIIQGILGAISYEGPMFDIFNLGESETTELKDLIARIEEAVGRKAIIEVLPEQPGDVPVTCADISKARKLLNYNPRTPISIGVPRYVDWLLSRTPDSKRLVTAA